MLIWREPTGIPTQTRGTGISGSENVQKLKWETIRKVYPTMCVLALSFLSEVKSSVFIAKRFN